MIVESDSSESDQEKEKNVKEQAQVDKTNLKLQHRIVKLDHKVDTKIAKFSTRLLQKKVTHMTVSAIRSSGNLRVFLPQTVA